MKVDFLLTILLYNPIAFVCTRMSPYDCLSIGTIIALNLRTLVVYLHSEVMWLSGLGVFYDFLKGEFRTKNIMALIINCKMNDTIAETENRFYVSIFLLWKCIRLPFIEIN